VITGLAHTALHVADVDAAVAWYHDVLGLTVLSPPYRMEGDAITRDMGELLPAPVVVKAAIVGVDDGSDRVIEVIEYPEVVTGEPRAGRGHGARLHARRAVVRRRRRDARRARSVGRPLPRRRHRGRRRSAHHVDERPVEQRLHPRREGPPPRASVLPPVLSAGTARGRRRAAVSAWRAASAASRPTSPSRGSPSRTPARRDRTATSRSRGGARPTARRCRSRRA